MNNLISVLLSTIKARITPIWTKIKYWTSWSFIKANILTKIRSALTSVFNVRPRNKTDYYPLFGFLISKRLAHAAVVVVGILCLCYLIWVNPFAGMGESTDGAGAAKVYSYNSLSLRFVKGPVRIRAKAGYIAYEGNVEKGYATGYGQLYNKDGGLVYQGSFEKNMFSGQGSLYYPIGQMQYEGEFQNNVFEGEGTLYRESGTKKYSGQFSRGEFEGEGILYDAAEKEVFKGSFHNGELVYTQLLGKSAEEIAKMYTGSRILYQDGTDSVVMLEDIDAFYVQSSENNSLDDTARADKIYVGKTEFVYGDYRISTVEELRKILGAPVFEGNSYVTFPEAAAIDRMQKKGTDIPLEIGMKARKPYDEVNEVTEYATDALVYLYAFQVEDVTYTFVCTERDGGFWMYSLEQ